MPDGPEIIDCRVCGLRYARNVVETETATEGQKFCACGTLLGSWNGRLRLEFVPEES